MNANKHPAEKSILIGMWLITLFGIYGMHRFYVGEKKAGLVIFLIALCAILGFLFKIQYFEYLMALSAIIFLFELITFYPRIKRYNENLTKYYL